jgi:hypothetical protein
MLDRSSLALVIAPYRGLRFVGAGRPGSIHTLGQVEVDRIDGPEIAAVPDQTGGSD